jgi:cation transport ATPase
MPSDYAAGGAAAGVHGGEVVPLPADDAVGPGPGRQFFVHSWNGLRRGVTDMNLLYATGIGAAYLIAVINTFWPHAGFGGREATFYEAAALLAFIVQAVISRR